MFKSIRAKLLSTHLLIALAGMIMVGAVAYHLAGKYLQNSQRQSMSFIVSHMGEMIVQQQNYSQDLLIRISHDPNVETFFQNYRVLAVTEALARYKKVFPSLSYINPEGEEEIRVDQGNANDDLRDFSLDPFLDKCREQPGLVFVTTSSADHRLPTQMVFYLGLKNYFGDEFTGVLRGSFPLSNFDMVLKSFHFSDLSYTAVVDYNANIIAANRSVDLDAPLFAGKIEIIELVDAIRSRRSGNWLGKTNGGEYFIAYSPVPGHDFAVLAGVSSRAFLAGLVSMRKAFFVIFAAACLLIVLIVIKLTATMVRPVVKMSAATKAVAAGNPTLIDIDGGEDEIGHLLQSFNTMVRDLKDTTVSKDYMDSVIHCMGDSLMVIRNDDSVETVNLATSRMLGYDQNVDLIGNKFAEIINMAPPEAGSWFDFLALHSDGLPIEMLYRTQDSHDLPVLFSSSLLRAKTGAIVGLVCVAHDISEIKESEEKVQGYMQKLKESNAELEEFAYVASHDLQEPLRKITGFGERLEQKYGDVLEDRGKDYLARMDNAARRMHTLINDLLTYSRVQSKARPFEPVDMTEIAQGVLSDLEIRIKDNEATVNVDKLHTIAADSLQMRQLLQNMIGNALKFCREGVKPEINVSGKIVPASTANGQEFYELTVSDNGIGFEEKYADRIFGVFQRLHGRSTYAGSGVGLSICKKIAKRHGGDITVQSVPGEGTKFIITLLCRHESEEG